jgi:transmembrane sensor
LDAGEQLIFVPDAPPKIAHVNLDRETAWQNGELIFKDEPLSSVVARINRYARHPVLIGDAATAALRISGVFHTGDERAFVTTIVSYLPVRALEDKGGAIRLLSAQ